MYSEDLKMVKPELHRTYAKGVYKISYYRVENRALDEKHNKSTLKIRTKENDNNYIMGRLLRTNKKICIQWSNMQYKKHM